MNMFKKIIDLYINSSIHVAVAVVSLSLLSFLEFNLPIDKSLVLFIFFGSITGYNFVKYAGIAKLHHRSLARNLKLIQVFSLICFVVFFYLVFQQELKILIASAILGAFTLLYAIPPGQHNQNLRNVGGIKIFIIAFVWAGVTVIFPALNKIEVGQLVLAFLQNFCFVVAITIPFEIRDLKFDADTLKTIPQQVGVENTKKMGYLLLGIMLLLELWKVNDPKVNLTALLLVLLISGFFIRYSRINQKDYFASFWVESIPIFWLISWLVINFFV
jgi:hypothetical protein